MQRTCGMAGASRRIRRRGRKGRVSFRSSVDSRGLSTVCRDMDIEAAGSKLRRTRRLMAVPSPPNRPECLQISCRQGSMAAICRAVTVGYHAPMPRTIRLAVPFLLLPLIALVPLARGQSAPPAALTLPKGQLIPKVDCPAAPGPAGPPGPPPPPQGQAHPEGHRPRPPGGELCALHPQELRPGPPLPHRLRARRPPPGGGAGPALSSGRREVRLPGRQLLQL